MIFYPKTLTSFSYVRETCALIHTLLDGTEKYISPSIENVDSRIAYKEMFGRCQYLCIAAGTDSVKMLEYLNSAKDGLRFETPPWTFDLAAYRSTPLKFKGMAVDHCIEAVTAVRTRFLMHS